jgi:probable lipoprotein NlpC
MVEGENPIAAAIQEFVGVPYLHGGRTKEGFDCLGLVRAFYAKFNIDIPENDGVMYEADWYKKDPGRLARGIMKVGQPITFDQLQALDLVYFRIGGAVTHIAVMVSPYEFLHVMKGERVHVSPMNFAWRRRYAGARRLKA